MENRYKIILSGNQIYKEAELPADVIAEYRAKGGAEA